MQSVRHRVSSLLRRSSFIGDKSEQSGSERESNSRPGSPSPSLRKVSGDAASKRRKRVSFSMRGRSGTADTAEHSQLAKQVADSIEADKPHETSEEPVVAVVTLPESGAEQAKSESPLGTADTSKETSLHEKNEHVPTAVDHPMELPQIEVEAASIMHPEETAATEHQPTTIDEHAKMEHAEVSKPLEAQEASTAKPGAVEVPFNMVMRDSPSHSMVNIAVVEPAPASHLEPAPYDTSFTSTSSAAGPSSPPLTMPVPRPIGQPLSAIDELHAKGHPLADWTQKDDVNYDADEYVRVMTIFFLLPAFLFLGLPYLFSYPAVLELAST